MLWTKGEQRASSGGVVSRILGAIGLGLLFILSCIGRAFAWIGRALLALVKKSRIALVASLMIAVVLVGSLVDFGMTAGRVYSGVRVGSIDASGKTTDELATLIEETYGHNLAQGMVTVYANEQAAEAAGSQTEAEAAQNEALAQQQTAEEQQAGLTSWTADAKVLQASLPANTLAEEALAVGREQGGLLSRVGSALFGTTIPMRADYVDDALDSFALTIDQTIGDVRVNYGMTVTDGYATVSEGHDGQMIDRNAFARELDQVFFETDTGSGSLVAHTAYAPVLVGPQEAQAACDQVNAAIADGVRLVCNGAEWDVDAAEVGSWVTSTVEEHDGSYALVPSLDPSQAKPAVVSFAKEHYDGAQPSVKFAVGDNDTVTVSAQGASEMPLATDTVATLNAALFGADSKAALAAAGTPGPAAPVEVTLEIGPIPATLSFDEALEMGLIEDIASYTTEFTTGSGTENRNHNINLVSQHLNNSIVEPNGRWSFNGVAGECNAANGFLGAGAIVDGEYDDAVGGGICQVATTVFNAVYDGGFPIITRHNHSLYIASYPQGRDAAVSWPDLDLVWENDTQSAVLVRVSCAESSVTATLYGVDPGYQVSTEVGSWEEGEEYQTKTEVDESMSPGTSYVKTRGSDGSQISVVRTVSDSSGKVLHQETFASVYDPVTEVIVAGPNTDTSKSPQSRISGTSG